MRNGGQPPNPRSLTHGAKGLDASEFGPCTVMNPRTARRQKPLWRSPPLRLLSSRAVSYGRLPMIACKALITSQLHYHKTRIRFCSVCQSGFEPSLSGFVPAPTEISSRQSRILSFYLRPFAQSPCADPYRRRLLTAAILFRRFLGE